MKLTLRELFLLILLVAVALGWLVDRRGLHASHARLRLQYDAACTLAGRFGILLSNDRGFALDWKNDGVSVYRPVDIQHSHDAFPIYSNVPDHTGATRDIWRLMGEPSSQARASK